jgi:hypothetical protein
MTEWAKTNFCWKITEKKQIFLQNQTIEIQIAFLDKTVWAKKHLTLMSLFNAATCGHTVVIFNKYKSVVI